MKQIEFCLLILLPVPDPRDEVFDIVPDMEEAHLQSFELARAYDAIVVAGGVSVGAKDLVKPTLQKLGAKLDLWRVAVKPGKPFMFGRLGTLWSSGCRVIRFPRL